MLKYFKALILIQLVYPVFLNGADPIRLEKTVKVMVPGNFLEHQEDQEHKLRLGNVLGEEKSFQRLSGTGVGMKLSESAHWLRFRVFNPEPKTRRYYLELSNPSFNMIDLYYLESPGRYRIKRMGDHLPFAWRDFNYRKFLLEFSQQEEQRLYILRFETNSRINLKLYLYDQKTLLSKFANETPFIWVYYGTLLILILYNLVIFIAVRDLSYFYFAIMTSFLLLIQFEISGFGYQHLWPNQVWFKNNSTGLFAGMAFIGAALYSMAFIDTRKHMPWIHRIHKIQIGAAISLMLLVLLFDFYQNQFIVGLAFFGCVNGILVSIRGSWKRIRPAFFYALSLGFIIGGVLLFLLAVLHLVPYTFLTSWGWHLGSVSMLLVLSLGHVDKLYRLRQQKRLAQETKIKTQEKYELLVEGTTDLIFTMTSEFKLLTANNSFCKQFDVSSDTLTRLQFFDLLFEDKAQPGADIAPFRDKFADFQKNQKPIEFQANFKSFIHSEFSEMLVRLEPFASGEILGKMTPGPENLLIRYIVSETQTYQLGNSFLTAEDLSYILTQNLKKFLPSGDVLHLRIGLREIIVNAIEHGNLEVTFQEKSKVLNEGDYLEFLGLRQMDPRYRDRIVMVESSLDSQKVIYVVTDQGPGFDHKARMNKKPDHELLHGRGISLAMSFFDKIVYNEVGNSVQLVKFLDEQ